MPILKQAADELTGVKAAAAAAQGLNKPPISQEVLEGARASSTAKLDAILGLQKLGAKKELEEPATEAAPPTKLEPGVYQDDSGSYFMVREDGIQPLSQRELADRAGFTEDVYHYSRADKTFDEFSPAESRGIQEFDRIGIHVGTKKAARDRAEYFNLDRPRGFTLPLKFRKGGRPLLGPNEKPLHEHILVGKLDSIRAQVQKRLEGTEYNGKLHEPYFGYDEQEKMIDEEFSKTLWSTYDYIPYYNVVEDAGSISYIVQPKDLKSQFAKFKDLDDGKLMTSVGIVVAGASASDADATVIGEKGRAGITENQVGDLVFRSFVGGDGKFRWELDDSEASLRMPVTDLGKKEKLKLSDLINHPTLFSIYPELGDYKIVLKDDEGLIRNRGSFDPNNNTITINPHSINKDVVGEFLFGSAENQVMEILFHEIQHAIQHIEGHSTGADYMDEYIKLLDEHPDLTEEELIKLAQERYKNSSGETEARRTGGRVRMPVNERAADRFER